MPAPATLPGVGPLDFHLFTGLEVPDPITFVLSPRWLNRPQLYPRQAPLLKVIFLRNDLLTEYDHEVIDEWEANFRTSGDNGIVPGIRERMAQLADLGYPHFREVLLVLGRRAGKGYVSALAFAYVLWRYMAKGDPQGHYGVARDKQLACFIYAGKKEQARVNLWQDVANVIIGAPCFSRYLSRSLGETLTVYAPHDFVRMRKLAERGVEPNRDLASFLIQPKEATVMSGRGPAAFALGFDEQAHLVTAAGASRSAKEVYDAASPALDQFKKDAFIIDPSSPWQQVGQFYESWTQTLEFDEDGLPVYPWMMMLQLESWAIYEDWTHAHLLPIFPDGFTGDLGEYTERPYPKLAKLKGAIQEYDDRMAKLEAANPDTFAVERRSKWQTVVDAYLDPGKIDAAFDSEQEMRTSRTSWNVFYKGHADPSRVNDNFAVAVAHPETGEDGYIRCVFDFVHHWRPDEFPEHTIDYTEIEDRLYDLITDFGTDEFTFDQWQSTMAIQRLNKRVRSAKIPKHIQIYEKTANQAHNWERAEVFKVALNQGWIAAPYYETAILELKFLQLKVTGNQYNKVVHQDTGPVTHDDVATAMMECVYTILGKQVNAYTHGDLRDFKLDALAQGGFDAYREQSADKDVMDRLSPAGRTSARAGGLNPARNPHRRAARRR